MKISLLLFVSLLSVQCIAQKLDYEKIKDSLCPSVCGWYDLETLREIEPRMMELDTNRLTKKSLFGFFDDFALIEYELYAFTMEADHLKLSAYYFSRAAFMNMKSAQSCYSAASQYSTLGECDKMEYFFRLYLDRAKRKELTEKRLDNLKFIKSKCYK